MMGSSHSASSALVCTALAGAVFSPDLVGLATAAAIGAGAGLLPDLDTASSTASRSQGPVSGLVCRLVRWGSCAVWRATRTPRDDGGWKDGTGAHRHLSHTFPAAVAVGLLAGLACVHWVGAAVVLWVLVSLVLRVVARSLPGGRWVRVRLPKGAPVWVVRVVRAVRQAGEWVVVSALAALATTVVLVVSPPSPVLVGVVVAAGMWVHVLGDWLTRAGVPLAWPLTVRGKRWWMWRSPLGFAADADCWQERAVRWVSLVGTPAVGLLMA